MSNYSSDEWVEPVSPEDEEYRWVRLPVVGEGKDDVILTRLGDIVRLRTRSGGVEVTFTDGPFAVVRGLDLAATMELLGIEAH